MLSLNPSGKHQYIKMTRKEVCSLTVRSIKHPEMFEVLSVNADKTMRLITRNALNHLMNRTEKTVARTLSKRGRLRKTL